MSASKLPVVSLDFETCSQCDLKKVSALRYAEDPTTRVICAAYAVDDGPVQLWLPGDPVPAPIRWVSAGSAILSAWNAQFEWAIIQRALSCSPAHTRYPHPGPVWPKIDLRYVRDTMAASTFAGYPAKLDEASRALLSTSFQKDMDGHRLMLRMSKPRKVEDDGTVRWWHEEDRDKLHALATYCMQDVVAERALRHALARTTPDLSREGFLPEGEQQVWEVDQLVNERGVSVDLELVDALIDVVEVELRELDRRLDQITKGQVQKCSNPQGLAKWVNDRLQQEGVSYQVESLAKDALPGLIEAARVRGFADIQEALELRQQAAKTSTAKLYALRTATSKDHRLRGTLQYYGAARTGRWAGRVFQPQNLPRGEFPKGFSPHGLIQNVKLAQGTTNRHQVFSQQLPAVSVMSGVSSLLRSCLWADGGRGLLLTPDLSQIEARVICWLAGQNDVLVVFANGEDVYVYTAQKIGSRDPKGDRQLGKVCALGLGFGMGPPKFRDTAAAAPYNIMLDEATAQRVVQDWRAANPRIVQLWQDLEWAFVQVLSYPGSIYRGGRSPIRFTSWRNGSGVDVEMRLPSGRPLYYRDCLIGHDQNGRRQITFMGLDPITKRWTRIKTYGGKLAENATQAVARDVIAACLVGLENVDGVDGTDERKGFRPVLSVHDEVVVELVQSRVLEKPGAPAAQHAVADIFSQVPSWAKGLPLAYETSTVARYTK